MFACMSSVKSALSFWRVFGRIDIIPSPVLFWFSKYAKLAPGIYESACDDEYLTQSGPTPGLMGRSGYKGQAC